MKTIFMLAMACLVSFSATAQHASVVVFKHELRWTDETRFPNYFLIAAVRDSIFSETKSELENYLKVTDIAFPEKVAYKIFTGFGKQKVEMPSNSNGNEPSIGIFSFITRATSGFAMFWNFNVIIKQNNKTILEKEVSHELEYFNVSGYASAKQWLTAGEFQEIYIRLLREALGVLPATDEKIIIGQQQVEEEEARLLLLQEDKQNESRSLLLQPERDMLKINGAWLSSGNFAAMLMQDNDTIFKSHFRDGVSWALAKPSFGAVLSSLFTEVTGIGIAYDQKVLNQKKGTLAFEDGQKIGIKLKWIEIATQTTFGDVQSSRITAPLVAELYDEKQQVGYFLYTRLEETRTTNETKESFNGFYGNQKVNTWGMDRIHRIEGSLFGKPAFAEYNESKGIIQIKTGNELMGVMVVINCNPLCRSTGNESLSKNKLFMTSTNQNVIRPSLKNEKSVEWYPVYFSANTNTTSRKLCIETLVCLFFGIGNM